MRPEVLQLQANLDVNTNFDALGGRVGLFAEIDYWFDSERWEKTLFSWAGFQESATLFTQKETAPLKDYIGWKYKQLKGASGFLGQPTTAEASTPSKPGLYRHFQGGSIYWSDATGAHEVHGYIRNKWGTLGWEQGILGFPKSDELTAPDNAGKYSFFEGGSLWYHPSTGNDAFLVKGSILQKWTALRRGMGVLGYPRTDELTTPDGRGRYNHFQNGSIYWTPQTGANEVHGLIRQKWADNSWERGVLGYPVTDESLTPDGMGRYNHFEGGSVYYHPEFGTHIVRGPVRDRWESLNWERGCLGYPKDEQRVTQIENTTTTVAGIPVPAQRKTITQNFEGGSVMFKEVCLGTQCKLDVNPVHQCTLIPIKIPPIVRMPIPTRPIPFPRPIPVPGPNGMVVDDAMDNGEIFEE